MRKQASVAIADARTCAGVERRTIPIRFEIRQSLRAIAPFLMVIAFWTICAAQWPLHDLVVPWDSKNQFYAFFRFMAEAIHAGSTPFWNPYHYAGHPSIADPQSLIFSPAFVLWALVDPAPSLFAFDLMVFGHLLVGGLAMVAIGRRRGWHDAGGVLAAMVFMLGGAVSGRMNHTGIIIAYGIFPLAALGMEIALDKRSWLAAIAFGIAMALIVLGRTQTPLLLCFAMAGLLLAHVLRQKTPLRFFTGRLPVLMLAGCICIAVATVPLLLTLQFADMSNRPEIRLSEALRSSLYPLNLASFFSPNVFGSLDPLSIGNWGPGYFTRPDVDSTDRAFNYLFVGSAPALLLVWHGLAGRRSFAQHTFILTIIGLFALLFAVGRYTPLYRFMFEHAPGIDLFRRPVDATFILVVMLSFICGDLLSRFVRDGSPQASRTALILCGGAVAALLAWAVAFSMQSGKGWQAVDAIGRSAIVYAVLLVVMTRATTARTRAIAASLAMLISGTELIAHNAANVMNAESRKNYAVLEDPTDEAKQIVDAIRQDSAARGVAHPRVEILGLGGPWQNVAMVLGLEATNGYNPLRIGSYDQLVAPGESNFAPTERRFPSSSFPEYDCLLGRVLGLQYVVLDRPIERLKKAARRPVSATLTAGPRIWVYRLADEPARVRRVTLESRVQVADADEFIDKGEYPDSISDSEVMVDAGDDLSQKYPAGVAAGSSHAEIVAWRPDRVEIAVTAATPNLLTLHDPWYPGWEVDVDGVSKPLLRTDILFRGVEVPAGAHRVVFAYRPLSLENLRAAAQLIWGGDE